MNAITTAHQPDASDDVTPLMFVPVPLATGTNVVDPESGAARRVDSIELLVRFADGTAQTRPLEREHTGWWLAG